MADRLSEALGYRFDRYIEAIQNETGASTEEFDETESIPRRYAESVALIADCSAAIRSVGTPVLLVLDNYEDIDYFRGLGSERQRNFCHQWVLRVVEELKSLSISFVISGRDIDHPSFGALSPLHQKIELSGLQAPDVRKMLLAAKGPATARVARLVSSYTEGHPQAIRYLIGHILQNRLDEAQLIAFLEEGRRLAPGTQSALVRILRYSWDDKFIPKHRRVEVLTERAAFSALVMLCQKTRYALQEEIITDAIQLLHDRIMPPSSLRSLKYDFPSLFDDDADVLHPVVSEHLFEALRTNSVPGVDATNLSKSLETALLQRQLKQFSKAGPALLRMPHWQAYEIRRISLLAWHDPAGTCDAAVRLVLIAVFVSAQRRDELLLALSDQAGTRLLPWFAELQKLCSNAPASSADLLIFFRRSLSTISNVEVRSIVQLAIRFLDLRVRSGAKDRTVPNSATSETIERVGRLGKRGSIETILYDEVARHFLFTRADLVGQSNTNALSQAISDYEFILENPGELFRRRWTTRAARQIFGLCLSSGRFDQAEKLLSAATNLGLSRASFEQRKSEWRNVQLGRAHEFMRTNDLQAALDVLFVVNSQLPEDEGVLSNLLRVLRRLGRREEAERFASILRKRPIGDMRSIVALGEIALMMGDIVAAKRHFENVFAMLEQNTSPTHKQQKIFASALNHVAEAALLTGDYSRACSLFSRRIEFGNRYAAERPNEAQRKREINVTKHAYTKRGFAQLLQDNRVAAKKSFEAALNIDPAYHHALLGLGLAVDEGQSPLMEASRSLMEYIRSQKGEIDPVTQMDQIHVGALLDLVIPLWDQFMELVGQADDLGKLHFLVKRLECSAKRFPSNQSLDLMLSELRRTLLSARDVAGEG